MLVNGDLSTWPVLQDSRSNKGVERAVQVSKKYYWKKLDKTAKIRVYVYA